MVTSKAGILIALEGIDGSGKSTQLALVGKKLRELGYSVYMTQEPSKAKIGKLLREYLMDKNSSPYIDALLFAADRFEHYLHEVQDKLEKGNIVITDRYVASSIVYQGAHGADADWIKMINSKVVKPDLSIYLDVDLDVSLSRIDKSSRIDIEKFENIQFLTKAVELYKNMLSDDFILIPANDDAETVSGRIIKAIVNRFYS